MLGVRVQGRIRVRARLGASVSVCVFECVCVCVRGCLASARSPGAETRISWGDRGGFPTQRDLRTATAVAGDASRTP